MKEYRKIEHYVHTLPCGCAEKTNDHENSCITSVVHPTLYELLDSPSPNIKMNHLDIKRYKKILNNLQSIKAWVSKEINFDESKRYEIVKELNKIARAFRQMATDVNIIYTRKEKDKIIFLFFLKGTTIFT